MNPAEIVEALNKKMKENSYPEEEILMRIPLYNLLSVIPK